MLKICVVVKCKPFLHGLPNQVLNPVWTYTFKRQVKDVLCVLPIHVPFGCLADSFMPGHFGLKQVQVGVWAYGLRMGDWTLNILTTGLHHTLYVHKCFTHFVCVCVCFLGNATCFNPSSPCCWSTFQQVNVDQREETYAHSPAVLPCVPHLVSPCGLNRSVDRLTGNIVSHGYRVVLRLLFYGPVPWNSFHVSDYHL